MNTELLQFLDGTLAPEQEAELLHRLSVSPERRDLLRSFFNQQVLFQRDRNSIAVPYAAEQKLWASLGQMMPPAMQTAAVPAAAVIETAATTASHSGFFSSAFSIASVAIICLLIGLGSGYFAGKNSMAENSHMAQTLSPSSGQTVFSPVGQNLSSSMQSSVRVTNINHIAKHSHLSNAAQSTLLHTEAPQVSDIHMSNNVNFANANAAVNNTNQELTTNSILPQISIVTPKQSATVYMRDPFQYSLQSPFNPEESNLPQKTFLQKFEFYFNEGIGKQFPNNAATNVSMPVVTNSSISAMFQAFANSHNILSNLLGGATLGTANVTMKKFRIAQKDPLDPKAGYEMVADLVHIQTTYGGPVLQYRIPEVLKKTAFYLNGTVAGSSAGMILGGEVGVHYDASSDVGVVGGLRITHLNYNIDAQQQQVIAQGVTSFGVLPATTTTQPTYNFEISLGTYFHF